MSRYTRYVLILMAVSAVVRALCAALIEFGNDEVYYRLYALFPDWSHFDHPGMVGWLTQLFTLNLAWDSEFALRLGSVVIGTVNIWLMYRFGTEAGGDSRIGWLSALLYVSSVYGSVLCGIFLMPDSPLSLFWMVTLLCFLKAFRDDEDTSGRWMLLAGLACGLAALSKYTAVFLWVGAGLYVIFFDRSWFRRKELYLAALISAACLLPVLIWNIQNDFLSFTYHSGRTMSQREIHLSLFFTELAGECFYNNPVLFLLIIVSVVLYFRRRLDVDRRTVSWMLLTALPMILIFWVWSCQKNTLPQWAGQRSVLPHWSGLAYVTLIPLAAAAAQKLDIKRKVNRWVAAAVGFAALLLPLAVLEIRTGVLPLDRHTEYNDMGRDDFTLDMYGWDQLSLEFSEVRDVSVGKGLASEDDPIFSYRWFPAANIDYYVASPLGMDLLCIGPMYDIHKYWWINRERGGLEDGMDGWFITSSRDFRDPASMPFGAVSGCDTVKVMRCGRHVYNFYIYRVENLQLDKIEQ